MRLHDAIQSYFDGRASFDDVVTFAMRKSIPYPSKAEYIAVMTLYGDENSLSEESKAKYIKQAVLFNDKRRILLTKSYNKNVPKKCAVQRILAALEDANVVYSCPLHASVRCSIGGGRINCRNGTELSIESDSVRTVFFIKNSRRNFFKDWFVLRHSDKQLKLVYAWAKRLGPLQHSSLVATEYAVLVEAWRAINAYITS